MRCGLVADLSGDGEILLSNLSEDAAPVSTYVLLIFMNCHPPDFTQLVRRIQRPFFASSRRTANISAPVALDHRRRSVRARYNSVPVKKVQPRNSASSSRSTSSLASSPCRWAKGGDDTDLGTGGISCRRLRWPEAAAAAPSLRQPRRRQRDAVISGAAATTSRRPFHLLAAVTARRRCSRAAAATPLVRQLC